MYSYALSEQEHGGEALLLTGDRDLYAAVSDRIAVIDLRKDSPAGGVGPQQVRERYGIEPEQVPDFIALRGDPSDGLPGAPGIGAKTAAELLREHGSLEALLAVAEEDARAAPHGASAGARLRPRAAAALRENAQLLRTFKSIATLQRIEVERAPDRASDFAGGAVAAGELGMRRLAERLQTLASLT